MVNLKLSAFMVLVALAASVAIAILTISGVDDVTAQGTNLTGFSNMTNATASGNMTNATDVESGQISGVARGL